LAEKYDYEQIGHGRLISDALIAMSAGRVGHPGDYHRPADLLRIDSDNLQCRRCQQAFPSVPEPAQARGH